ncbi:MAG: hypothetical protein OFPII_10040 [Osedax symbiont Rs1]|nr:MAG: hypothetical protein OFPII_10040 [Osedax symbiont Rs1]
MKKLIVFLCLIPFYAQANEVSKYTCSIGGVYEVLKGKLVQRKGERAIGELLYINADNGIVTGYFSSEDWAVTKIKRPEGILTAETAEGFLGDGLNRLRISPIKDSNDYSLLYTKNWLYISGTCKAIFK